MQELDAASCSVEAFRTLQEMNRPVVIRGRQWANSAKLLCHSLGPQLLVLTTTICLSSLPGAVSDWPAMRLWRGQEGLKRLQGMAGDAQVQVCWSC